MQNKSAGHQSPSEGVQVGWEIYAGHLDFTAQLRMSSHSA